MSLEPAEAIKIAVRVVTLSRSIRRAARKASDGGRKITREEWAVIAQSAESLIREIIGAVD